MAEFLRDLDHDVLCLMDSVTRFAMAQREIGLSRRRAADHQGLYADGLRRAAAAAGARRPRHAGKGSITGLFTVLVEGDDHNEPIADAVRAILDGHIVLDRAIAERGRYPAINVLRSISRTMPGCNSRGGERASSPRRAAYLATYEDMAELIRLGAYRTRQRSRRSTRRSASIRRSRPSSRRGRTSAPISRAAMPGSPQSSGAAVP